MTKNIMYEVALQSLERLLSKERLDSIVQTTPRSGPIDKDDRSFWYHKAYPVFLQSFADTKNYNHAVEVWIQRVAMVFSWIPRIPVVRLDEQAIHKLAELENMFNLGELWEIKFESYLGGLSDPVLGIHHGERIFGTGQDRTPVLVKTFVQLANAILNYGDTRLNLPTTTKLLHFMFPNLFPIFDTNVCQSIFGNNRIEDYYKYHAYIFALQDYLSKSTGKEVLFISKELGLPPLRVIDLVLFQDGINVSRSKK